MSERRFETHTMDEELERRVRFLRAARTDGMARTERGLLGTRQLLMDWGARAAFCDAGLFHSVYGTEHYPPVSLWRRWKALFDDAPCAAVEMCCSWVRWHGIV